MCWEGGGGEGGGVQGIVGMNQSLCAHTHTTLCKLLLSVKAISEVRGRTEGLPNKDRVFPTRDRGFPYKGQRVSLQVDRKFPYKGQSKKGVPNNPDK